SGKISLTSMPAAPHFWKAKGDFISLPPLRTPGMFSGGSLPSCVVSPGLGSNVSTCDGPPFMNRKMTRFAFGVKCPARGASGLLAARAVLSVARTPASPRRPNPAPMPRSMSRREIADGVKTFMVTGLRVASVHEEEFVGPEKHLGVAVPGGYLQVFH